ncbi:hypothetical protein [Bradyrhizobium sp. CCGE-LA001]|uniref:hypothetical protein n=1 Tax=Bradyrhizobium sp. CCGE-LA001 TaxID=1223566 RepID=UPI0002AADE95|nr:hypothetical protein [Bradyrhizobium sp. CCGE-LA001]AMA60009.1 hypothetical protein BCCGELA001_29710 [Bradyrhizobium sp. CCGE-LA001]
MAIGTYIDIARREGAGLVVPVETPSVLLPRRHLTRVFINLDSATVIGELFASARNPHELPIVDAPDFHANRSAAIKNNTMVIAG